MRRLIAFATLALLIGLVLGGTVFRNDIAQATALAQAVTVANTSANPVPVHEQGTADVTVNGTVAVAPAVPANSFSTRFSGFAAIDCSDPGDHWFISSFAAANDSDTASAKVILNLSGAGFSSPGPTLVIPPNQTAQLTFPQPFDFVVQQSACLHVTVETTDFATVATWEVVGYHD